MTSPNQPATIQTFHGRLNAPSSGDETDLFTRLRSDATAELILEAGDTIDFGPWHPAISSHG